MRKKFSDLLLLEGASVQLQEGAAEGSKPLPSGAIARLTFKQIQMGDRLNRNGRCYPTEYLVKAGQRFVEEKIGTKTAEMFDGHTGDSGYYSSGPERKPTESLALMESLEVNEAEGLLGPATVLLFDGEKSRVILSKARLGVPIGVSSVGQASVRQGKHKGKFGEVEGTIVGADLHFERWDFVSNPSVSSAVSTGLQENAMDEIDLEKLKEENEEAYDKIMEQARTQLLPEIEEQVVLAVEAAESKMEEELRAELNKPVEEQIKAKDVVIAEKDEEIDGLEDQIETLESKCKELEGEVKKLGEELAAAKKKLGESTTETKSQLKKMEEQIAASNAAAAQKEAVAHVKERIANHPMRSRLTVMLLGPQNSDSPKLTDDDKKLNEEFKDIKPPMSIAEADRRFADIARSSKAITGISVLDLIEDHTTERGSTKSNKGKEELDESADHAFRMQFGIPSDAKLA